MIATADIMRWLRRCSIRPKLFTVTRGISTEKAPLPILSPPASTVVDMLKAIAAQIKPATMRIVPIARMISLLWHDSAEGECSVTNLTFVWSTLRRVAVGDLLRELRLTPNDA